MASECCLSLTKYFLFLFNLIFFVMPSPPYISISLFSYLLIVSGSVTMSLGFLGCLGSLKTVKCLLATYFILLTVLLAAQIVGGVLFYTQKTEVTQQTLIVTLESLKQDITSTITSPQAKCCGWDGKEDWGDSIPCSCYDKGNATVNATYEIKDQKCFKCFSNGTLSNYTCGIYNQGCSENIKEWLDENLLIIFVIILSISVVEVSKLSPNTLDPIQTIQITITLYCPNLKLMRINKVKWCSVS
uniref:Tetraspanin n=1 Tax=Sinocyclocheilus rhinocerous TaxID=307959 RepID=A0A673MNZ8_9TELE